MARQLPFVFSQSVARKGSYSVWLTLFFITPLTWWEEITVRNINYTKFIYIFRSLKKTVIWGFSSCKTRMDIKCRTIKHRTTIESHNGSNNQQRVNNNRTTALERTTAEVTKLLVPNLRPRFCCCRSTQLLSTHGGFLTITTHYQGEII